MSVPVASINRDYLALVAGRLAQEAGAWSSRPPRSSRRLVEMTLGYLLLVFAALAVVALTSFVDLKNTVRPGLDGLLEVFSWLLLGIAILSYLTARLLVSGFPMLLRRLRGGYPEVPEALVEGLTQEIVRSAAAAKEPGSSTVAS